MGVRDLEVDPPIEQAVAMLQQLASAFLVAASGPVEASSAPEASDSLPEAISGTIIVDEGSLVIHLDEDAERTFRCASSDVVGLPLSLLLVAEPSQATRTGQGRRRDGTLFQATIQRSRLQVNGTTLTLVSFRDDESVRQVHLERQRSALRFRHLVEQIPAVTFTAELAGGLHEIYVSPQIESLLGYTQREWVSNPVLWYERLHPEDRTKLDAQFALGCMTGGPFQAECRFLSRSGAVVWVHGEARIIRDASGIPVFLQGVAFNVTDIRRLHEEQAARAAAEEAHRRELLLSEVTRTLAQAFAAEPPLDVVAGLLVPAHGDCCLVDLFGADGAQRRVAVRHAGGASRATAELLRGTAPCWDLGGDCSEHDPEARRILAATGGGSLVAASLRTRDRLLGVVVLVAMAPRQLDDDDARLLRLVAERITLLLDNRRLYQNAQDAVHARERVVEELERAVRFSEMFVGVLGHDLRNPLSAIVTGASLLIRRNPSMEVGRTSTRILNAASRMQRMIDQILDFTRIRIGHGLPPQCVSIHLADVCNAVVEELQGERDASHVEIRNRGDLSGCWDGDRLAQLFSNLVGNALQHRVKDTKVLVELDGSDPHEVVARIRNQGEIPTEILPVIFEPLRITESKKAAGSSGLGLGLFISREIVLSHRGTIQVASSEPEGTCFEVRLPRQPSTYEEGHE